MSKPIQDIPKSRGRPKTTGRGEGVLVRLQPLLLAKLDSYIAEQPNPQPSRPEAVRKILEDKLHPRSDDEGMRPEELNASNDD